MLIRSATAHDYDAYARLFGELNTPDPVPSRERWDHELWARTWVADAGGAVAGFLYWQLLDGAAYVRQLVVEAAHRRKGVGRALMRQLAAHLATLGCTTWELNVDPTNGPAVALYEGLGMSLRYASTSLCFDWAVVPGLPPCADPVTVGRLDPTLDGAAERRWQLPPGQLAGLRALPGRVVAGAWSGTTVLGVAVFDPSFPGSFPFRVASPEHARCLLETLRPHAQHDYMQIVAEDDAPLETLLTSHGATVRHRFVHFRGPLPL